MSVCGELKWRAILPASVVGIPRGPVQSVGHMRSTARGSLGAIVLLAATAAGAQTTSADRAQRLWAKTAGGQEAAVACGEVEEDVGRALIDLGEQARGESLERLTIAYRLAERSARCAGSDRLLGAALNDLSDTLFGRGQFEAALAAAVESIQVHDRSKDTAGLAEGWNRAGNAHFRLNDSKAAIDEFNRALDLSLAAGDRVGQGRAWNNIGNVQRAVGELNAALDSYRRALATFEDLGDRFRTAVVNNNIGFAHFIQGEYASALRYGQHALELNRALGDRVRIAASLDLLGNTYRALGAYRLALQSFQEALALRTAAGNRAGVMESTNNIGLVYFSQGDYQLAIHAYRQGLRLNRAWGLRDHQFVAEATRNIGAAAWQLGQRERAVANFRASLVIAQREHSRNLEGEVVHDLGQAALANGNLPEASRLFGRALGICTGIGDQAGITDAFISQASVRLAGHRYGAALDLAQRALDNSTAHDQPELRWKAQTVMGTAFRRLHRLADAGRALGDAVRSIEQLSAQVTGGESLRERFLEDKLSPFHELIALMVEAGSFRDALELAERAKARVLAQLLRGHRPDEDAILAADDRRERARRRDALFSLNRQIENEQGKKTPDEPRLEALESARRDARERLADLDASLVARYPELAAVRGEVAPLTFADTNRLLTDRATAIVEFTVADRQLFAFLLTSDGGHVAIEGRAIRLDAADLAARAERFRARVSARDFDFGDDARALYRLLLGPFREHLAGKSRLIIVPDGALWNVPFQALLGPDGYLIESVAVSYAPSITVLREIRRLTNRPGASTLLAMGKSTFGPSASSALGPLPDAERQVRLIQDIYGEDRSVTYVGNDATEGRFKAAAPHYSVLHLATHGLLDETSPLYSYLVLSTAADDPADDGRLEAWEIMHLKLAADVVVLAACDTGRGQIAPGEGVIGTMWALFAAGARSMVVSQFPVESTSATELLVAFHRQLAAGRGAKAAHLRAAALEVLHTARYAHPYYWAGFILVGDSD
jgi:CHAT domain-containing protein/Tfp pilus assembly protein PilF